LPKIFVKFLKAEKLTNAKAAVWNILATVIKIELLNNFFFKTVKPENYNCFCTFVNIFFKIKNE